MKTFKDIVLGCARHWDDEHPAKKATKGAKGKMVAASPAKVTATTKTKKVVASPAKATATPKIKRVVASPVQPKATAATEAKEKSSPPSAKK